MTPRKKKLVETLAILGIAIALLGTLEIAVRIYSRVTTGQWMNTQSEMFHSQVLASMEMVRLHPFINTAPREGARTVAFGKVITFNSLGYRSSERPEKKSEGSFRILCSGGSTTLDMLAQNDAETWPWLLEQALVDRGFQAEIWNSSVPAWSSLENLISLMIRDIDLEPDVLVLFQGINDLRPASFEPFDRQYEGHARQVRDVMGFHLQPLRWHQRSILLETLRMKLSGPKSPYELLRIRHEGERLQTLQEAGVKIFERNVRSFIAAGKARGSSVVLLTQMLRIREDHAAQDQGYLGGMFPGLAPEAAIAGLDQLNDVLRKLAAEEGVIFADANRDVQWEDEDFGDPMHFSPRGSQRFGRYLEGFVAAELDRLRERNLTVDPADLAPGSSSS